VIAIAAIGCAVLYAIFLWWFSTGAILWLDRRPRNTYALSLVGGSMVGAAAIFGLVHTMTQTSPRAAVIAFTSALGVWGWHELSFLTGFISGPRKTSCPPGATGWRRFVLASSTLIYHEIALILTGGVLWAILHTQPNKVGLWTFGVLLVSRLSSKFNLFLGVPNFSTEFFPDHLRYLTSYLRKGPINALFPVSIAAGCALAWAEAAPALRPDATPFEVVGYSLVLALTALALIEHAFMVLPLHDAALWRWALPASAKNGAPCLIQRGVNDHGL
jgi:putative photosynthetic complex assembly protein 2